MAGTVCLINIGPRERRKRLGFGLVMLGASAVLGVLLVIRHMPAVMGVTMWIPLFMAGLGYFQAREKT
jgi:hypothetical protein